MPIIATACCGDAQASPDVAQTVISAMRAAEGGDRWSGIRSLHLVMEVAAGGRTAPAERWEDVSTGRYVMRESWPDRSTQTGFDGVTPWRLGRSGFAYALGDVDAGLVAADESFRVSRARWFPDRHAATIALTGTRSENRRGFDVLEITPQGGRPFEAWIDRTTHLLARTDEQQAEDRVVTTYADYRAVGGVMLPFTIRSGDGSDPADDEIQTIETVEIDPPVPDRLYAIPPRPPNDVVFPPHRDSVDVPFRLTADDRIMVPVRVDDHKTFEAEFDSGGDLILQPATVAALALATEGRSKQSGGGEGSTFATNGRVGRLALGSALIDGLSFLSFPFAPDQPDKMLVGLEILQRFVVRLDFDRDIMTLTRPTAFRDRGDGAVVPFQFQDNQPEVRGSIDGIAALLTIDTGDAGSLGIIAPFARRYGLVARYQADIPYSGRAIGATNGVWARKRAGTVAFDGDDGRPVAQVDQPVTRISLQHTGFDADREVSANIGLGILRQFNLTFDYARQRIILEPNHLHGRRDVFNRAGLRLARRGSAWSVTAVHPGSPAAEAGLKPGSMVSRIDGQTAETLGPEGLWSKLLAPVGTKLDLQVDGPAMRKHAVLILRDLL